jgi:hypothetical protein
MARSSNQASPAAVAGDATRRMHLDGGKNRGGGDRAEARSLPRDDTSRRGFVRSHGPSPGAVTGEPAGAMTRGIHLSHISTVETARGRRQWTDGQAQRMREATSLRGSVGLRPPGCRRGDRRQSRPSDTDTGAHLAIRIASAIWHHGRAIRTPATRKVGYRRGRDRLADPSCRANWLPADVSRRLSGRRPCGSLLRAGLDGRHARLGAREVETDRPPKTWAAKPTGLAKSSVFSTSTSRPTRRRPTSYDLGWERWRPVGPRCASSTPARCAQASVHAAEESRDKAIARWCGQGGAPARPSRARGAPAAFSQRSWTRSLFEDASWRFGVY